MASAKKETTFVTKMVETQVPVTTYTFEVDIDEMKTLRAILNRVGGSPTNSPREHAEAISEALDHVMGRDRYDWGWARETTGLVRGGDIRFLDYGSTDETE